MSKKEVAFSKGGLFSANQNITKAFKILIGCIKSGPLKRPLLFWTCKQANTL